MSKRSSSRQMIADSRYDPHDPLAVSPQLDYTVDFATPRPLCSRNKHKTVNYRSLPASATVVARLTSSLAQRHDVLLLLQPRVDDVDDVRDGQPRLGNVGRDDDLALVIRGSVEDLTLLDVGEVSVERGGEDLRGYYKVSAWKNALAAVFSALPSLTSSIPGGSCLLHCSRLLTRLSISSWPRDRIIIGPFVSSCGMGGLHVLEYRLTRHKHQDIPWRQIEVNLQTLPKSRLDLVRSRISLGVVDDDRISSSLDEEDRCAVKVNRGRFSGRQDRSESSAKQRDDRTGLAC
jgi:hypothetical protein